MKYTDLCVQAEKALEGVTDGPWTVPGQPDKICAEGYTKNGAAKTIATVATPSWMTDAEPWANARFIAFTRAWVPAAAAAIRELEAERDEFRSCLAMTSGKLMVAEARVAELTRERDAVEALDVIRKNGAEATAAAMILHIAETLDAKGKAVLTTGDDFGAQVLEYAAAIRNGATP